MNLDKLQRKLNYQFNNPNLLEKALTHRSYHANNNERLEFIGDSILNFVIAAALFKRFDKLTEGELTRVRAQLVNQDCLAGLAFELNLSEQMRLGEGELKSGGFRRPSILADALEAIFGAIYLDSDILQAQNVILAIYANLLENINPKELAKDAKSFLQEKTQAQKLGVPQYNVLQIEGEAHQQTFYVECLILDLKIRTTGVGSSRRQAEQNAAKAALEIIKSSAMIKS